MNLGLFILLEQYKPPLLKLLSDSGNDRILKVNVKAAA